MGNLNLDGHSYIKFIRYVMRDGHEIQFNDNTADVILSKSRWRVKCYFSYNETKIYFEFGQNYPLRVMDSGQQSATFLNKMDSALCSCLEFRDEFCD